MRITPVNWTKSRSRRTGPPFREPSSKLHPNRPCEGTCRSFRFNRMMRVLKKSPPLIRRAFTFNYQDSCKLIYFVLKKETRASMHS